MAFFGPARCCLVRGLCEHGRVRTVCADCRAAVPKDAAELLLDKMLLLVDAQPEWQTEEQGKTFHAARAPRDGLQFRPESGSNWPPEPRVDLLRVIRKFEERETRGYPATASDAHDLTRSS